ncbi:MAG: hypothetical protein B9S32_07195 [Verrucomicrobia bacterium Tous-C9LFEB]|nr:MAG: hypothetical protein B9S32_07195 [Verrucomicrobia bacterium Tous-C9LFEB]
MRPTLLLPAIGVLCALSPLVRGETPPYSITANDEWKVADQADLEIKAGSALDLSVLFGPTIEAGRDGFALINDKGELAFTKKPDQPLRFLCSGGLPIFPSASPEEIERLAEQLKRSGYNMSRAHFLDLYLMQGSTKDLEFNPDRLDRWDRWSAALKKRGVYLYLDASTSWASYYAVENPWSQEAHDKHLKSRVYYDEAARAHWKEGVRRLFTHVNPYTGVALKDEPQVAIVQLRNEAGLNFLMNLSKERDPAIVVPFRQWLTKRYGTTEKLAAAWGALPTGQTLETVELPPLNGKGRATQDLQWFFVDIERETFQWMAKTIRELGVKVPLLDFNIGASIQTSLARDVAPMADTHAYHDHPNGWINPGSAITGESAFSTALGFYRWIASARQWGRPFVCSEWGQVFWNPWRHESGLTIPVYAALQNWQMQAQHADAIHFDSNAPIKPFWIFNDPPLKAAEVMSALLYRRGDVRPSPHRVEIVLEPNTAPKNTLLQDTPSSQIARLALITGLGVRVNPWPGAAPRAPYRADWSLAPEGGESVTTRDGVQEVAVTESASNQNLNDVITKLKRLGILSADNRTNPDAGLYESDTNQILLNEKQRRILVSTPLSAGGTLPPGESVQIGTVTARNLGTNHATLFVGSLTRQPLAESDRLVLLIATDAVNSGMSFTDASRRKLVAIGTAPVLSQVARVQFQLRYQRPAALKLWALAANGERREEIPLTVDKDGITATLDTGKLAHGPTPYFEIQQVPR